MSIFDKFKKQNIEPRRNSRSGNVLALDIGTEWVKALVFFKENGRVHTVGYGRSRQQAGAMKGGMITNIQNVKENCDLAIAEACKNLESKEYPESLYLGIAGEIVNGEVVYANYEREMPEQIITEEELHDIESKLREETSDSIKVEIGKKHGISHAEIVEVSSTRKDCYINGLRVSDLVGFKGKSVSFKIFFSFTQDQHIQSIRTIAEYLGLSIAKITVVPFAIANNYSGSEKERFSGVFADIGAGTTDVAMVSNGSFVGVKMFALGGRAFTHRVQKLLNIDYLKAEKIKIRMSDDPKTDIIKLNDKQMIQRAFEKDARVLVSGIQVSLSDMDELETYPTRIFLSGGGAKLSQIQESIRTFAWLNYLPFEKFPEPELIYPRDLRNLVDEKNLLTDIDDVSVSAIALESLLN